MSSANVEVIVVYALIFWVTPSPEEPWPTLGKLTTAVFPAGMFEFTCQFPGSVTDSVCDQPETGLNTSCPT